MVMILGISGKKQAGKNTMANVMHGEILKSLGSIEDFSINEVGQLVIKTSVCGDEEFGILDVTRRDKSFFEYAHYNIWPYIKLYSFADGLKGLCMEFFGISSDQAYGTDDDKNTYTKIMWEDTPTWEISSRNKNRGSMTARELLQYFGTDIMRKMYYNVWVDHAINTIQREQSKLAVVADVRFPNEVEAIKSAGGKVVRLTRQYQNDGHSSECALDEENYDWKNFDYVLDNSSNSPESFCGQVSKLFNKLELTC